MEEYKKQIILNNINFLIKYTNYNDLISAYKMRNKLTPNIIEVIQNKPNYSDHQKHGRLFLSISKSGVASYEIFKEICKSLGYQDVLHLLLQQEEKGEEEKGKTRKKIVRFDDTNTKIHLIPYYERKGPWETFAVDRFRFQQRIHNTEKMLEHIFTDNHRRKIYSSRFNN